MFGQIFRVSLPLDDGEHLIERRLGRLELGSLEETLVGLLELFLNLLGPLGPDIGVQRVLLDQLLHGILPKRFVHVDVRLLAVLIEDRVAVVILGRPLDPLGSGSVRLVGELIQNRRADRKPTLVSFGEHLEHNNAGIEVGTFSVAEAATDTLGNVFDSVGKLGDSLSRVHTHDVATNVTGSLFKSKVASGRSIGSTTTGTTHLLGLLLGRLLVVQLGLLDNLVETLSRDASLATSSRNMHTIITDDVLEVRLGDIALGVVNNVQ